LVGTISVKEIFILDGDTNFSVGIKHLWVKICFKPGFLVKVKGKYLLIVM